MVSFLANTYRCYKQDTNDVATWLATTAQSFGFRVDLLSGPNQKEPVERSQRLKGKARKEAKKAATSNGSPSSSRAATSSIPAPKYVIKIQDFVTLAGYVSQNPNLVVPTSIWKILERSIDIRQIHNDHYTELEGSTPSNRKHANFLNVLKQVRDTLKPRVNIESRKAQNCAAESATAAPIGANSLTDEDADARLHNMFAGLTVEEPSDVFLSAPDVVTQPVTRAQVMVESTDDPLEIYLGVAALLEDCSRIRDTLRQTWAKFAQGATSLTSASITSNVAVQLVQELEANFLKDFPSLSDTALARQAFFAVQCSLRGQDPGAQARPGDPINLRPYDLLEVSLMVSHVLVDAFGNVLKLNPLPLYKPGFYGVYDPTRNRKGMTGPEKFDEDKIVLLEVLSNIVLFDYMHKSDRLSAVDEFSRAVGLFREQRKHSLALDFAAQTHLDIQHILRGNCGMACAQLRNYGKNVVASLGQNKEFHAKIKLTTWPQQNDIVLQRVMASISRLCSHDMLLDFKNKQFTKGGGQPDMSAEQFFFFKSHPWLCGSLLFGLKLDMQAASVGFINAFGAVKVTAQLYNAMQVEKLLHRLWEDMELAMGFYGQSAIFVGSAPRGLDDCFKRFCLSMGYSAQNFAHGGTRPGRGPIESRTGPRGTIEEKRITPVAYHLRPGYTKFDNSGCMTADLEAVAQVCLDDDDARQAEENGQLVRQSSTGKPRAKHEYTSSEFLSALCQSLADEELPLTFDHFRLHRQCWRLLRAVKDAIANDLRRIYGPEYLESEGQLPFLVGYVLMTAVQTKKFGTMLLPKKDTVTSALLQQAAKCTEDMINIGAGALELRILREQYAMEVTMEIE